MDTITEASVLTRYDLHSHTTASDGLLIPSELVQRAVTMGVDVLAITDHDTTAGLAQAAETIWQRNLPLRLINGVEISTLWEKYEIHVVGLNIDVAHAGLCELLYEQSQHRFHRAQEISLRLEKIGIPGVWQGASHLVGNGQVTRAHFARYLVDAGHGKNTAEVFKKYLIKGKAGYVPALWCSIQQAIEAISRAGGQSVLAHPGRYHLSIKELRRLLSHFAGQGGDAMEVAQCQQASGEREQLGQLARDFNLLASLGSDFHQPCSWIELGHKLWLPAGAEAVWRDWS